MAGRVVCGPVFDVVVVLLINFQWSPSPKCGSALERYIIM